MTKVNDTGLNSSILIISLVQSATTFLRNSLSETLGVPVYRRLSGGTWNTTDLLFPVALDELRQTPHVAYTHAHPLPINFTMMNTAFDRAILNIRDPRQALVSMVHFIDQHVLPKPVYFAAHQFPAGYEDRSFDWKLAYHLEHTYPGLVSWIEGWIRASEEGALTTRLLEIQHQNLKRDHIGYFQEIYRFYDLDADRLPVPEDRPQKGENYFRTGDNDEWRRILDEQQIRCANALIPDWFWDRFQWVP